MTLHPEHLADLRKSALTDETIKAAAIYTVPPGDIGKKLGGLGNNVVSALAFPYHGFDGFERFKVWWKDGKNGPKYLQKTGTANHLYLLPTADLKGDSPLLVVEGEKKALALMQAGYHVVGISGIWNWCERGQGYKRPKEARPIPDFDLVNWKRLVSIIFDSDGHANPMVRLAAWRLARELARRGGQVSILFLPHGENGEKVGADDYIVKHGPEALRDLLKTSRPFDPAKSETEIEVDWVLMGITAESSTFDKLTALAGLAPILARLSHMEVAAALEDLRHRFNLRSLDLAGLRADVKAARKSRERKAKKGVAAIGLSELEDVRRCHPAVDFLGGPVPEAMVFGFRVPTPDGEEGLLLVLSDGHGVRAEVNPEAVKLGDVDYQITDGSPPLLEDVWSLAALKFFIETPARPGSLYQNLLTAFKKYLYLQDTAAYGFLAAWSVGTYLTQIFAAVPFVHFYGPKETGKSKALEVLRFTCCNAYKSRDISAPALGDTVDGMRGTVLIDQAERLGMVNNAGEGTVNLLGLLADSYKKAGGRRRVVEMSAGGRRVIEFRTFGFKGFASLKPLDPDLSDRCIPIAMTRTGHRLPDLEGHEPVWATLRDQCYRFALGGFQKVDAAYRGTSGDGTRITELWRPLAAVLTALDVGEAEFQAVKGFFMAKAEEARHVPDGWELSFLEALEVRALLSPDLFEWTVGDLLEAMEVDSKEKPGAKWAGETLTKFCLFAKKSRVRRQGKKVTAYTFDRARVLQIIEIFLRNTPPDDMSHMSTDENCNDFNDIHVEDPNDGTCPPMSPNDGNGGDRPGHVPDDEPVPGEPFENAKEMAGGTGGAGQTGCAEEKYSHFSETGIDPMGGDL